MNTRFVAVLSVGLLGAGCWPGRCEGALRTVLPTDDGPTTTPIVVTKDASFSINADSHAERSPAQLLADSRLGPDGLILEGPGGPVPYDLDARLTTAHSCASGATFTIKPRAPLAPGNYTLAVLLDRVAWPAVFSGDTETFRGHPALVRRYLVR